MQTLPLIRRAALHLLGTTVILCTFTSALQAQPRPAPPAPVPPAVVMPRPTGSEVATARSSLTAYLASLDADTRALYQKYPYLLEVRPPGINTAIVPNLSPNFVPKHEANVAVAKAGNIDVLFMGDSITDWWRNETGPYAGKQAFDKYFANLNVANFGIAGDTTQGVLFRLQNGEGQGFSPKAVMLMIGTNNTRSHRAQEIAEGVGAIVLELQKDFPDAKIMLLGIFPRAKADDPLRTQIAEINSIISKLHDGEKVFYRDIGSIFLDADGNIPTDIMSDGLHPTPKGYELWGDAIDEPLKALL